MYLIPNHKKSLQLNVVCTLKKMSHLNYQSRYSRQLLDSVLTALRIEHQDVFSLTEKQCKTYVYGLQKWMGSTATYLAIDNCREALNMNAPSLCY